MQSDRALLRRLLQNFISNAIKYTPHGRVLVGCRRRGPSLQICIYDTGVGIPIVKRGEIFKEFHRLEQGARIARGLGLGLSIVERIARVLNHGIAIDANAGGGSVFSVTVPTAAAINYTAAVTSATPLAQTPISGARIVCIENDPAILDGMKTLLKAWNAEVIAVTDPDAAVEAIEAAGGRVTNLHYHLDRGNGVAAIRDIRRRFNENLPAILITADRSPHVRAAVREENIAVLNKPVKLALLCALLGQWRIEQMIAAEELLLRRRALLPLAAGDLGRSDHRLRAALDTEFLQDRRDMRLDGGLGNTELVGDLLVEQPFRQHHQDPNLLRRQRHQAVTQARHVGIGRGRQVGVGGNPDVALHHLEDGIAQRLDAETLRNEPGGAEIERAADRGAVVGSRDDHHRDRRILRAQIDQAGKAGDPGHREVKQDQVDVGGLFQQLGQILERSGLVDPCRGQDARHRLPQRIAEQGMVIGNDEMG